MYMFSFKIIYSSLIKSYCNY